MAITYLDGNIFESTQQVVVCPINCEGKMGASLALIFKQKYPGLYKDYLYKFKNNELKIGFPYLWKPEDETNQWVLNFPTKDKWQEPSKLEYISEGLKYFVMNYQNWGIKSISFPALGCGLGKLNINKVFPLMEKYLKPLNIDIHIYKPLDLTRDL